MQLTFRTIFSYGVEWQIFVYSTLFTIISLMWQCKYYFCYKTEILQIEHNKSFIETNIQPFSYPFIHLTSLFKFEATYIFRAL